MAESSKKYFLFEWVESINQWIYYGVFNDLEELKKTKEILDKISEKETIVGKLVTLKELEEQKGYMCLTCGSDEDVKIFMGQLCCQECVEKIRGEK